MRKRDYISMIGKLDDSFGDNGWADGWADLPSDHEEILNQLYGKVPNENLVEYIDLYLQGYELGNWMSEEIEELYDEDDEFKDKDLGTFSHYKEAKELVLKRIENN